MRVRVRLWLSGRAVLLLPGLVLRVSLEVVWLGGGFRGGGSCSLHYIR